MKTIRKVISICISTILAASGIFSHAIILHANDFDPSVGLGEEVLHVSFEGNVKDASKYGNDGKVIGNPVYVDGVIGKAIHIVNENGSSSKAAQQYVNFGQSDALKFGDHDFSITYWFRTDTMIGDGASIISNKNSSSGENYGFCTRVFKTSERVNFKANGGSRKDIYNSAPNDGAWHKITVNFQRDKSIVSYVDGVQSGSTTISGDAGKSIDVADLCLGADGYGKYSLNEGYIDELQIYKKTLDKDVILEDYLKDKLAFGISSGKAFYEDAIHNSKYDAAKLDEVNKMIEEAEKLQGTSLNKAAVEASVEAIANAVAAAKDGIDDIIQNQMLYLSFDDETLDDQTGRNNHGIPHGEMAYEMGMQGKALHLANDLQTATYVDFADKDDFHFGTEDFAIALWYKATGSGTLLSTQLDPAQPGISIEQQLNTLHVSFMARDGEAKAIDINGDEDGLWHYLVIDIDRDNSMSVYIDNQLVNALSIAQDAEHSLDASTLRIGSSDPALQEDLYIDEVRIFKRMMTKTEKETFYYPLRFASLLEKMYADTLQAAKDPALSEKKVVQFTAAYESFAAIKPEATTSEMMEMIDRMAIAYQRLYEEARESDLSFQVISDIHLEGSDPTLVTVSEFRDVLQDIPYFDPDSSLLMIAGDLTNSGAQAEYNTFFNYLDTYSSTDVMAALGNHDVRWLCSSSDRNEAGLRIPTCKPGTSPYKDRYLGGNKKYMGDAADGQVYYDKWVNGYHFITLNTEEDLKDQAYISDEQLAWLEVKLAEQASKDKPIFLQIHQTFAGTSGVGEQDQIGAETEEKLKTILAEYPQAVIFTGHTHNGVDLLEVYHKDYGHVVDVPCLWYASRGNTKITRIGWQVEVKGSEVTLRIRDYANDTYLDDYTWHFDVQDPLPRDPADSSYDISLDKNVTITAGSEQNKSGKEGPAYNLLDNDLSTIWHTVWAGTEYENLWVELDLGKPTEIDGLRYLPRQNSSNGRIKGYRIEAEVNGEMKTVAEGTWKNDYSWKLVNFIPITTQKIRLYATEIQTSSAIYASGAELRLTAPAVSTDELAACLSEMEYLLYEDEKYTESSWNAWYGAYTAGDTLLAEGNFTSSDLQAAVDALRMRESELIVKAADYIVDGLQATWEECKALEAKYDAETFAPMQELLTAAERLLAKGYNDIGEAEANHMIMALVDMRIAMEKAESQNKLMENLKALLKTANAVLESPEIASVRPGKVKALEDQVALAQALVTSESTDEEALNAAIQNILQALQELYGIVDKSALQVLIDHVDTYKAADYTQVSWEACMRALQHAQTVVQNDDASTDDVKTAYLDLLNAMNGLKIRLDDSALCVMIQEAQKVITNQDVYLPSTIRGLNSLLESAYAILENEQATQQEIDEMTKQLLNAVTKARLKADKQPLQTALQLAMKADAELYSAQNYQDLVMLIEKANVLMDDQTCTQAEVDELANDIMKLLKDTQEPVKDQNDSVVDEQIQEQEQQVPNPSPLNETKIKAALHEMKPLSKTNVIYAGAKTADHSNVNLAWSMLLLSASVLFMRKRRNIDQG